MEYAYKERAIPLLNWDLIEYPKELGIKKVISLSKDQEQALIQRIYDKKKGTSYINIGPPKTKSSARTIPVPTPLMNIIKKFYTENPNHYFLTGKMKPTEPRTYRQFFTRFLNCG